MEEKVFKYVKKVTGVAAKTTLTGISHSYKEEEEIDTEFSS